MRCLCCELCCGEVFVVSCVVVRCFVESCVLAMYCGKLCFGEVFLL